jgi:thiamine-phosphate pyrophosphorylase
LFGDPDRHGRRLDFDALKERLTWWVELFEVPCIAFAASKDEVAPLSRTGVDFIALGDWIWSQPEGAAAAVAAANAIMSEAVT